MRCTEVADRPVPNREFTGRDIGDRGRSQLSGGHKKWRIAHEQRSN